MIIEHIFEAFLFGVGLSMDALAASLASGASEGRNFTWKKILLTAFLYLVGAAAAFALAIFSGKYAFPPAYLIHTADSNYKDSCEPVPASARKK